MVIFIVGILLLIYGYLCRLVGIYFFWDSKHFGWFTIVTAFLSFLIDRRKAGLALKQNIVLIRIGIGIIILAFATVASTTILLKNSYVYENAIERIRDDIGIKNEVGDIRRFGMFPSGSGIISIVSGAGYNASFVITVRGSKACRDVQIGLTRITEALWSITSVRVIYL